MRNKNVMAMNRHCDESPAGSARKQSLANFIEMLLRKMFLITMGLLPRTPCGRLVAMTTLTFLASSAMAKDINIDLGEGSQFTSKIIQIIAMLTVFSLAPSILMMVTSFTRIVIVFSFLRSALGLQQSPPNSVLISL